MNKKNRKYKGKGKEKWETATGPKPTPVAQRPSTSGQPSTPVRRQAGPPGQSHIRSLALRNCWHVGRGCQPHDTPARTHRHVDPVLQSCALAAPSYVR
jgi:hypothetical protein